MSQLRRKGHRDSVFALFFQPPTTPGSSSPVWQFLGLYATQPQTIGDLPQCEAGWYKVFSLDSATEGTVIQVQEQDVFKKQMDTLTAQIRATAGLASIDTDRAAQLQLLAFTLIEDDSKPVPTV